MDDDNLPFQVDHLTMREDLKTVPGWIAIDADICSQSALASTRIRPSRAQMGAPHCSSSSTLRFRTAAELPGKLCDPHLWGAFRGLGSPEKNRSVSFQNQFADDELIMVLARLKFPSAPVRVSYPRMKPWSFARMESNDGWQWQLPTGSRSSPGTSSVVPSARPAQGFGGRFQISTSTVFTGGLQCRRTPLTPVSLRLISKVPTSLEGCEFRYRHQRRRKESETWTTMLMCARTDFEHHWRSGT
jgi:hypothetical protein